MNFTERTSGLVVPETDRADLPQFETHTFIVYREEDVTNFRQLVADTGGDVVCIAEIPSLNWKNQRVGSQYLCVYQWHEDLTMEVLT